ncbi:MAG TPA: PorP/SprF family type IX secretion system membrane protein [Bacteroidia bacterium]|nr:PorP/SprF family type IX secretion system membrane protein [Bacteroidia bacterium]
MKRQLVFWLALVCAEMHAQHNPLRSQYLLDPVAINPGSAGIKGFLSATTSYRRQWIGIPGAPETFSFAVQTPLRKKSFNCGLLFSNDKLAVTRRTELSFIYAYRIFAKKFSFAAGVSPGIIMEQNRWNEIITTDAGDEAFSGGIQNNILPSMGYGIFLHSKRFVFSASGRQLIPAPEWRKQPFVIYSGYMMGDPKGITMTISALTRMVISGSLQADANILVEFKNRLGIGASYRLNESVSGLLTFQANEQLQFGYSYDLILSGLRNYSSGSHEIHLCYDFGYRVEAKSPRNF